MALVLGGPARARAQLYESVGIRAQGLAGAFVAVADDATTTWWNPAGLASGPLVNGVVEHVEALGGSDDKASGVAFAIPSLGLSYYRLRISEKPSSGSTESASGDRQDRGTTGIRLPTHVLTQFGATVGQSLGDHLVIGSTLKVVWADQARGDFDLGAMVAFERVRLAAVARNVVAAELTADGHLVAPSRQVRVGGAYLPSPRGSVAIVAAVDADLTRTATPVGDERRVTGGVELGWGPRYAVRGGVGVNTAGSVQGSFSGGVSARLLKGLSADAQITQGDDEATKGWGIGLRVTF